MSTWSHKNGVNKHFVIFPNLPCLIACLLCCLPMCFFFACFVVRDFCRRGWRINYHLNPPPPHLPPIFSLPTILSLTQVTVICKQCVPKAGVGAV